MNLSVFWLSGYCQILNIGLRVYFSYWCTGISLQACMFGRELAGQIAEQFKIFGKGFGVRVATIIGGVGELTLVDFC